MQKRTELTLSPDEIEMLLEMSTVICLVDNDDNRIIKIDPCTSVTEPSFKTQKQQSSEDDMSLELLFQEPPV